MEHQRLTWLLERHLADNATQQEQQELSVLLKANANGEVFKTVIAEMMQKETPAFPVNLEPWQKMIGNVVNTDKVGYEKDRPIGKVIRLYRWSANVAVLLLVGLGIYFLMNRLLPATPKGNDVMHYQVVSTARSNQKKVVLPDGSQVWLNAASTIRYPDSFGSQERSVELYGEAWFDVQHDEQVPFIIHTGNITTRVIGTAFDIKAYPGQQNRIISVQRGKVNVMAGDKILATLEKGRQVRIIGTVCEVRDIDTVSVAAWKLGNLYYKDESFGDIIADLQRVFKDSIQIKNNSLKAIVTTEAFNKDIGLHKALEILCNITDGRLSKKDGIYIIE
jgi:ferric-dicitrate binding protein FerR (iron transport regulator)